MTVLEALTAWADAQPTPGSYIEAGPSALRLPDGWRGLVIRSGETFDEGHSTPAGATLLTAALTVTSDRFVEQAPGWLVGAVHPSELYPLWDALPLPCVAIVTAPPALALLELLADWRRIEAFVLTVADTEEAQRAGAWVSAGAWRARAQDGLTIFCERGAR